MVVSTKAHTEGIGHVLVTYVGAVLVSERDARRLQGRGRRKGALLVKVELVGPVGFGSVVYPLRIWLDVQAAVVVGVGLYDEVEPLAEVADEFLLFDAWHHLRHEHLPTGGGDSLKGGGKYLWRDHKAGRQDLHLDSFARRDHRLHLKVECVATARLSGGGKFMLFRGERYIAPHDADDTRARIACDVLHVHRSPEGVVSSYGAEVGMGRGVEVAVLVEAPFVLTAVVGVVWDDAHAIGKGRQSDVCRNDCLAPVCVGGDQLIQAVAQGHVDRPKEGRVYEVRRVRKACLLKDEVEQYPQLKRRP